MRLTIINGSPRGASSNTGILMGHFEKGFLENPGNSIETLYVIKERPGFDKLIAAFLEAECILLAFPLYVDAMPGSVKEFIESLKPLKGRRPDLTMIYMVQNGFPETYHNRYVDRYLRKLTQRLGCVYGGSILKGGCEGLDVQPPFLVDKVFRRFYEIGKSFGENRVLDNALLAKLAHPEHLTSENIRQVIPMVNGFLWDSLLQKNNATELSFARPYLPGETADGS